MLDWASLPDICLVLHCEACWNFLASYALGFKPLSILTPLSLVQKCVYLHSVHFAPCCNLHLCWELCCFRVCISFRQFKAFPFCIAGSCWDLIRPILCACFGSPTFCKNWLKDLFQLFLLVLYHKVYDVYNQLVKKYSVYKDVLYFRYGLFLILAHT